MDLHIQTARLHLRPTLHTDAPAIFAAYASDPVATRYLPFGTITDVDRVVRYVARTIDERSRGRCVTWAIILRDEDRLIGTIDLTIDTRDANIGFAIGCAWWGLGIVPEAARAVLDLARDHFDIRRVRGTCDFENVQSARVFQKLGFERLQDGKARSKAPSLGPDLRRAMVFEIGLQSLPGGR